MSKERGWVPGLPGYLGTWVPWYLATQAPRYPVNCS